MRRKKGGLENKKQKHNLYKDARHSRYLESVQSREDPDSSENLQEVERRSDELEKTFTGKHEAAPDESEIHERKHYNDDDGSNKR